MNTKRGFRRVAWLVTIVAAPLFFMLAFQLSEQTARYDVVEITEDPPDGKSWPGTSVEVPNVGILYFPSYMTKKEMTAVSREESLKKGRTAATVGSNNHIVTFFKVEPVLERRPVWAAGLALAATVALALLLHGSISAFSWVAQGFRDGS